MKLSGIKGDIEKDFSCVLTGNHVPFHLLLKGGRGKRGFFDFFVSDLSRFYANAKKEKDRIGSIEKTLR